MVNVLEITRRKINNIYFRIHRSGKNLQKKQPKKCVPDLTVVVPTYNRSILLIKGIEYNSIFSGSKKAVIDDYSNKENREMLREYSSNDRENVYYFKSENMGVGHSLTIAKDLVYSKYVSFCGDDDIVIINDYENLIEEMSRIGNDYSVLVPRHMFFLYKGNRLKMGYDRKSYDSSSGEDAIRTFFSNKGISGLFAGSVFLSGNLSGNLVDPLFTVAEDHVFLLRFFDKYPRKKIKVSSNFSYIRRMSDTSLSKTIDQYKLFLCFLAELVNIYYCKKYALFGDEDLKKYVVKSASRLLIFEKDPSSIINTTLGYLYGQLPFSSFFDLFRSLLNERGKCANDLPEECSKLYNLFRGEL
ncbi:MAG TPA: glycosyltransferase [Thermotogota bacterium]|nr:glycosyltransferase [Thermotogota bacterium]